MDKFQIAQSRKSEKPESIPRVALALAHDRMREDPRPKALRSLLAYWRWLTRPSPVGPDDL